MTKEEALENKRRVQQEAHDAVVLANGRGCLEEATGVGKTKIGLHVLETLKDTVLSLESRDMQTLIVVPTEEMRDIDWPEEFEKWSIPMDNVKIICYSSLVKEKLEKYDFIIYDEYHRTTLKNLRKLQQYLTDPKVYALALTATLPKEVFFEEDRERIELMKELLPTVHKITTDQAVELGLICDFHVTVLKFFLDEVNTNIRGGTLKAPFNQSEGARYKYLTNNLKRSMILAGSDPKKQGMKFAAMSKRAQFLYNLPSKLRLAKKCLEQLLREDKRTVVFAGSIEQANVLCGVDVYHSESTREALDKFQKKEIPVLGAVKALNEGKNLTEPDQGLIVQVDSVERNLVQRFGRFLRIRYENLDHKAKIVILVALKTADEEWYNKAIKDFETSRINEYTVKIPPIEHGS